MANLAKTGQIIAQKYRLESLLGQGGMGSVWLAQHLELRAPVAVKLLDAGVAQHPDARARFIREARASANLRSPHVVQVFDFGLEEDVPFIVMECLEGETLADRLEREGCISTADTSTVVTHVARAIQKAHEQGIIHRDLKPANVFLVQNEDELIAKVLDFGIAKALREGDGTAGELSRFGMTRTGAMLGSPYYMSPEQAHGKKTIDHRSDLWSMGVIAFECITALRPFDGTALSEVVLRISSDPIVVPSSVAPVPVGFDDWFKKATARNVERRFQSAKEMALALRTITTSSHQDRAGERLSNEEHESAPQIDVSVGSLHSTEPPNQDGLATTQVSAGSDAAQVQSELSPVIDVVPSSALAAAAKASPRRVTFGSTTGAVSGEKSWRTREGQGSWLPLGAFFTCVLLAWVGWIAFGARETTQGTNAASHSGPAAADASASLP